MLPYFEESKFRSGFEALLLSGVLLIRYLIKAFFKELFCNVSMIAVLLNASLIVAYGSYMVILL